jgi:tetratricopeptide (TPR) repeat protein
MAPSPARNDLIGRIAPGFTLVLLVLAAYVRVWHAGFIWDDDAHLTQNVCIVGPAGFKEIWTTAEATYYPLVLTTFWIVHKLAGLNPLPYHVVNVLLHAASAVLLWRVLRRLDVRGAWLGAALWALHPVMVQSVAWITEMKNTQSCVFFLGSILLFMKWNDTAAADRWRPLGFAAALLFAVFAMTSKTSTVVLPAVLALCIWWKRGTWRRGNLTALAPFFAIAAAASIWTIWEQKFHSGASGAEWAQTFPERLIIAGRDIWFYLGKLVWPHPLIFIYPRWRIDSSQPLQYLPLATVIAAAIVLSLSRTKPLRAITFAAAYFIIALLPVLGFFDVFFFRYSFVSDHFQYLASIGPLALTGSAIAVGAQRSAVTLYGLGSVMVAALILLTWQQMRMYSDAETLWRTTLAQNPQCWMAHYELARGLRDRHQLDAAIEEYQRGLAIWPDYADAHYNLAGIYLEKGDADKAISEYRTAIRLQPNDAELHNNLGSALLQRGSREDAIAEYEAALRLHPNLAAAHVNIARALLQTGDLDRAIEHFRASVSTDPANAEAHSDLGAALLRKGDIAAAMKELDTTLSLNPNDLSALTNLSWLLATSADAATRNGPRAVALATHANDLTHSADPFALHSLAAAYAEVGQFDKAIDAADRAIASPHANAALVNALGREIESYRARIPYRRSR